MLALNLNDFILFLLKNNQVSGTVVHKQLKQNNRRVSRRLFLFISRVTAQA